jgi:hypothetical protein
MPDNDNIIDIQRQLHDVLLAEIREHRRETYEHRRETREQTELLVSFHRSLSSRLGGMEEHLIDTLKIELAGKTAPMETRLEHHVDYRVSELLAGLIARIEALEKAR